jgi:hypothetical protein
MNQSGGDYRLSPTSFAHGRGSNGTDLGADMNTLLAGIQGVVSAAPAAGQPRTSAPVTPQHFRIVR